MASSKPKVSPREKILNAALQTFGAHGVAGTSIADVAQAAGMSKQALMHHFRTKEDLRAAVYEHLAARLRDVFPLVAGELVRMPEDYGGVIAHVAERLIANPEIARFLIHELLSEPEELMGWLRTETAPWLGLVRGIIDQNRSRRPDTIELDVDAHLTILTTLMLVLSALIPRNNRRWWSRVQSAALRVMRLGSHLEA